MAGQPEKDVMRKSTHGRAAVKDAVYFRGQRYRSLTLPGLDHMTAEASSPPLSSGKSVWANGPDAEAGTGPEPTWLPLTQSWWPASRE